MEPKSLSSVLALAFQEIPAGLRALLEPLIGNALNKYNPVVLEPEKPEDRTHCMTALSALSESGCVMRMIQATVDGKPAVIVAAISTAPSA